MARRIIPIRRREAQSQLYADFMFMHILVEVAERLGLSLKGHSAQVEVTWRGTVLVISKKILRLWLCPDRAASKLETQRTQYKTAFRGISYLRGERERLGSDFSQQQEMQLAHLEVLMNGRIPILPDAAAMIYDSRYTPIQQKVVGLPRAAWAELKKGLPTS